MFLVCYLYSTLQISLFSFNLKRFPSFSIVFSIVFYIVPYCDNCGFFHPEETKYIFA